MIAGFHKYNNDLPDTDFYIFLKKEDVEENCLEARLVCFANKELSHDFPEKIKLKFYGKEKFLTGIEIKEKKTN